LKQSILAPLLSAVILPGLGQVTNRRLIKGLILMGLSALLFLALIIKAAFDFTAVLNDIAGMDPTGESLVPLVLRGMKERDLTSLYVMVAIGAAVWMYAIVDAAIDGRRIDLIRTGGAAHETDTH
jgi:hypothetical protein